MGVEFGIVHSLWDHAADRGEFLERVAGEVGLDHITVPVVTGAQAEFRCACEPQQPHFRTEGGWHFPPTAESYVPTGLRPPKARWLTSTNHLAHLCDQAERLAVRLMLRIDIRGVRGLLDVRPHLCQRNAWGQETPEAGACICNPELRQLLQATLTDVGRFNPAGFELMDWRLDAAANRDASRPLDWRPVVRRLLDMCFCPSCREIAAQEGVDVDAAAKNVRAEVERHLSSSGGEPPAPEDAVLEAYSAARRANCTAWLVRLAQAEPERRTFLVHDFGEPQTLGDGTPVQGLLREPARGEGVSDGLGWGAFAQAAAGGGGVALPVWHQTFQAPADLVRIVSELAHAGVSYFDMEGLGETFGDAVTWVKQAARFARRG